jgi:hypothetical protein
LSAARDLVADDVRIERAIRLVGDEVAEEEQGHADRQRNERVHEAGRHQRERSHRSAGDDEGQAAADLRPQLIRPRADKQRYEQSQQTLCPDQEPDHHRGACKAPCQHRQVGRDDRDRKREAERGQAKQRKGALFASGQ